MCAHARTPRWFYGVGKNSKQPANAQKLHVTRHYVVWVWVCVSVVCSRSALAADVEVGVCVCVSLALACTNTQHASNRARAPRYNDIYVTHSRGHRPHTGKHTFSRCVRLLDVASLPYQDMWNVERLHKTYLCATWKLIRTIRMNGIRK